MKQFIFNKTLVFFIMFLLCLTIISTGEYKAYAAGAITIAEVDYEEEEIVINNNGNTKILFATETEASKNNWDSMKADPGNTSSLDFSWLSNTTDHVLFIKGGDDSQETSIAIYILKRTAKLDITISYASMGSLQKTDTIASLMNIMTTQGTGNDPILFDHLEWRKGESGRWKDVNSLTVAQLEKYMIRGADLYFRIRAVNDVSGTGNPNPNGTKGSRASIETRVKIVKKAASTAVGVDGSKFTADIKYGKEYRVTINGVTGGWNKVEDKTVKRVDLETIVKKLGDTSDGGVNPFPEMFLEVRSYATAKTAASKITEMYLNAQRELNQSQLREEEVPKDAGVTDPNIYISYQGIKNMNITIPSASAASPYEYTVVKPGASLNMSKAVWTSISKSSAVKILSSKAEDGSTLYIRQKEIRYKKATSKAEEIGFQLASTYVTHKVSYPSVPVIDSKSFTYVKGMGYDDIEFEIKLNTKGSQPYETKVKNIRLGTRDMEFEQKIVPEISDTQPLDPENEYKLLITLKKEDLEKVPNTHSRALTINFDNSYSDKTSIRLTVKNPSVAMQLTAVAEKGTTPGSTKINITSPKPTANIHAYFVSATPVERLYEEEYKKLPAYTVYTSGSEITVGTGYIIMMELNPQTETIVRYKSIAITANEIAP